MKLKLLTAVYGILLVAFATAQVPQGLNYQAVARNASGNVLQNQSINVRYTIHYGNANGPVVYQEKNTPSTNQFGLFSVVVGSGTPLQGTFAGIQWSANVTFLQVELDHTGGNNYIDMGTSQLQSVPYALYAETSGNGIGPVGPSGATGDPGIQGVAGADGATGATGPSQITYKYLATSIATNAVRNALVFSADSIIITQTGTYQVSIYAHGLDVDAGYATTVYDTEANVLIYNSTTSSNLILPQTFATRISDEKSNSTTYHSMFSIPVAYSSVIYLQAGHVIKAAARVTSTGLPSAVWNMNDIQLIFVKLQ